MIGIVVDVGVQQSDVEGALFEQPQASNQILRDIAGPVTHTMHNDAPGALIEDRHRLELGAESMATRRIRQASLPTVERIVVSMAYEGTDPCLVEPFQPFDESKLGTEAAVGSVIDISRYEERVDLFENTEVDQIAEGIERGLAQALCNVIRNSGAQPCERAVKMQISSVYESKWRHGS
jgi:hypothetical protein